TSLSADRRTAIVIGFVYFVLFLAASTASRYSGRFSRRIKGVVQSINITWIIGFSMLILAGVFQGLSVYVVTIGAYLVLFTLQNIRRPLCVTYISDKVPHRVMASGLSVESLIKTLAMTILAPVCGYIADLAGVGITIAAAGVLMGLLYVPLRLGKPVRESAFAR
ncbi:MAG: MFS transporter, partial [Candidatus Aegiribacteria sp.]|nr:MFS transporter [Candidatus Aegiribacteria sp.]